MSKKGYGIQDLTETEKQPGYCPERLAKQIEGCLPPETRVDERGFKYVVYPRDLKHERWKNRTPKIKKPIAKTIQLKELQEIDLSLEY
jgi:hypothetical protein